MKLLILSSILACSAYGFSFSNIHYEPEEIAPANSCAGQPNGMRLPAPGDCNRFILCDNGVGMTLACRATEPHFDRCTQRCVNDVSVCNIADCPGEPGPPPDVPPPDVPTPGPDPPAPPPVTPAPPPATTFNPPTVPVVIPCLNPDGSVDPCNDPDPEGSCECDEQWGCWRGVCSCNPGVQCSFPNTDCLRYCGCQSNCNCENGPTQCVCHSPCRCNEPPAVCPFLPSQCVARCICQGRCICNGDFCTCDADESC